MGMVKRTEAAEILGISLPTLKKRTAEGLYNTIRQGRNIMYFEEELEEGRKPMLPAVNKEEASALPVPTLSDIIEGSYSQELSELQEKKRGFMVLLNNEPPENWLKTNPLAKRKNSKGQEEPILHLT